MTIQDWPVNYDELEPYYDRFEKLCGMSGKAGNIRGKIKPGGNPFEGWRSSEYPTPPLKQNYGPALFAEAARKTGHVPFPQPASNLSEAYLNPLGVKLGQCTYCGFCERFGCGNYSKASPQTCVLPALLRFPNFTAQTESEVTKINLDSTGKRATGVTYVDTSGEEWEQPANIVLVCAFALFNVRLMLLSGIGKPYDPQSGQGVVGRNYAYQTMSSVNLIFEGQDPQYVHGDRRERHDDRRLQRRQFRSRRARVRRRRLHGHGADQRPADRDHAGATRHAEMGRAMEEGRRGNLSARDVAQRSRQLLQLSRLLARSRPDLQGSARPPADADDVRFPRQRAEDVRQPHPTLAEIAARLGPDGDRQPFRARGPIR